MRVWTVANQKGGVGKTTTAVSLAGLLAEQGRPTLIVDMDPHGSMTSYFGHDPDTLESGVYSLFQQGVAAAGPVDFDAVLAATNIPNLHLLPAASAMASLDRQLGAREGMGLIMRRALAQWAARIEHVIIDCPPMLGVLMVNALAACERVIIPVQTEFLALKGLERLEHTLRMVARTRKPPLPDTIVPTMFDRRTRASVDSLQALRERWQAHLWSSVIPIDTSFRDASRAGVPLSLMRPGARGAQAYADLLDFLLDAEEASQVLKEAI